MHVDDSENLLSAAREAHETAERLTQEDAHDRAWLLALVPLLMAGYFVLSVVVR